MIVLLDTMRQMTDSIPVKMALDILKETIIYHEGDEVSSEARTYLRDRMRKLERCIEVNKGDDPWKRLRRNMIGT